MKDIIERRLLIEQTRKELLESLKQYLVGWCRDGELIAKKSGGEWSGYLLLIPNEKYEELFHR